MNPNLLTLSHATYVGPSGATAAATYSFVTKGYQPPAQDRHIEYDVVHNQNGLFKYIYDNGPGFRKWAPFSVACENAFASIVGATAAMQLTRLREMWAHPGVLGMSAPDAVYTVHWAQQALEQNFKIFPKEVNHLKEYEVVVQFEEGQ